MALPSDGGSGTSSALTKRELAAWSLYLVAFGLSVGHQLWLLQAHLTLLVDYKYEPWTFGYVHAVPTYVPAAVSLLVFVIACCCRPHGSSLWAPAGAAVLAAGSVNTLTYPVQVIVYMCHDILLFLTVLPTNVTCLCWPETALVLLNSTRGHICDCYLPKEGQVRFVMAEGANVTRQAFAQIGYDTGDDVNVTYVERVGDAWPGDRINTWDTVSFRTLLLLLQSCIIVTICRLPMYLLLQHLTFSDRQHKANKDIRQRAHDITQRPGSGRHVFQRLARLRLEQVKFQSQIGRERRVTLHTIIELCYFNFVEGLDAFTLIDDVVHYGDYFVLISPLTVAVLTFVSITVILVTTSNVVAMFPEGLDRYTRYTKLFVVILGNLPFLVIRCYLSYLAGGLTNRGLSTIFLMFVVKEVLVLLMGTVEFFMEFYAEDTHEGNLRQTWADRTTWNLARLKGQGSLLQLFFHSREDTETDIKNVADDIRHAPSGISNAAFETGKQEDAVPQLEVPVVLQVSPPKQKKSEVVLQVSPPKQEKSE